MNFFKQSNDDNEYCMVGYKVENTLSDNGTVTRGVRHKDDNGYLSAIKEVMNIKWNDNHDGVQMQEEDNYILVGYF